MSINIILSNSTDKATDVCIAKLLENYSLTKKIIVLTTDRNTLQIERKILDMLPSGGAANIDVLTFSRLSSRYLSGAKICLTPEGSVMLMSKAIGKIKDKLSYYWHSVTTDGFTRDMYTTITALRNCSVTTEMLSNTVKNLPYNLAAKTLDIILIYDTYIELLSKSYYDGTSRLEALELYLNDNNPFFGVDVYISGFPSFNGQSLAIIDKLVTRASNITVALSSFPLYENARLYPIKTLSQLREIFSRYGEKVSEELHIKDTPFSTAIENKLFSYEKITETKSGNIELFSAKSVFSEAEFIAYSIRSAVKNQNLRYKDIAVVCPSAASYRDAFAKYFGLYNIPYHIDEDEVIGKHCFVKLIDGMFETVQQNFKRESLFKVLKNPLLKFSFDKITEYENFAIAFDVNYNRFLNSEKLSIFHQYDAVRETASLVSEFCKGLMPLSAKHNSADFVNCLYGILESLDVEKRISEMEQMLFDDGDLSMKEMSKHIYEKVKELFRIIVMINGAEDNISVREFYILFKNSVQNEKMVLLPVSNDCIIIRSVENASFGNLDTLYICGVSEGHFPLETSEQTIITLKEASILHKNNCPFEPTQRDNAVSGRYNILQLLLTNYDKLILSYSESHTDGTHGSLSHIAARIANIFDIEVKLVDSIINFYAISEANSNCFDIIATEENAKRIFLSRVISAQGATRGISQNELAVYDCIYDTLCSNGKICEKSFYRELSADSLHVDCIKLYFEKLKSSDKKVSVSELENYFRCPKLHFYRYGLSAKPIKNAELESLEIGLIVHDILENFFNKKDYKNLNIPNTVKKLLAECEMLRVYQANDKDKAVEIMLKNLHNECVNVIETMLEYENGSEFSPRAIEKFFDTSKLDGGAFYCEVKDEKIYFYGKIDRIDAAENKLILFDYKTGVADASLANIYYGTKIQLFFYMKCLISDGKSVPAAIFYVPVTAKYTNEGMKKKPFIGNAVLEEKTLKQIDKNAFSDGKFVSVKVNKDGTYAKRQSGLLSEQEFRAVCNYTSAVVKRALSEIGDGYIAEKPIIQKNGACEFCEFFSCCKTNVGEKSVRKTANTPKNENFINCITGGNNGEKVD